MTDTNPHGVKIQTRTGRYLDPFNIDPDEITLPDIAHALTNLCRYTGHTRRFYSVAEHSLLVASLVDDELKLAALLHDAPEAYLGDLVRPVKMRPEFAFYREAESRAARAVESAFGLEAGATEHEDIKRADLLALAVERIALMPDDGLEWPGVPAPPLGVDVPLVEPANLVSMFAFEVAAQL